MPTPTKRLLSGSTDGLLIQVTGTTYAGRVTIHTATSASGVAAEVDELYIWVVNVDTTARTLTLQWGATDADTHRIAKAFAVPASSSPLPIICGLPLNNSQVVSEIGRAHV